MGRLVVLSYLLTMEIVLSLHALRATILSSVVHTTNMLRNDVKIFNTVLAKPLEVSKFGRHFYVLSCVL